MTIFGYDFEGYFTYANLKLRLKLWLMRHHVRCRLNDWELQTIYEACEGEPELRKIMDACLQHRK